MERLLNLKDFSLEGLKPPLPLLKTQQKVRDKDGKTVIVDQTLFLGTPGGVRLVSEDNHFIRYVDSARKASGRGLENTVLYIAKTWQKVLVVDSDNLNYPYLAFLASLGAISSPFNFIHIDAHMDVTEIESSPPKMRKNLFGSNMSEILNYSRDYVRDYNFVTALCGSKLVDYFHYIGLDDPLFFLMQGYRPGSTVEQYGAKISWHYPESDSFSENLFIPGKPTVLAFDLDYFGHRVALGLGKSLAEEAELLIGKLFDAGYDSDNVAVISFATSPGYSEGYKNEEEVLETITYISFLLGL